VTELVTDGKGRKIEAPEAATVATDRRRDLLALCTETKRLARAEKEAGKVQFLVDGPDLWIAAVGAYNVVLDLGASRLQHGCRDFQGEVRERRLCKHVAGLLLAIDEEVAIPILERIVDPVGDWHLEAMVARGFGKS
jgi:hypothetical protein